MPHCSIKLTHIRHRFSHPTLHLHDTSILQKKNNNKKRKRKERVMWSWCEPFIQPYEINVRISRWSTKYNRHSQWKTKCKWHSIFISRIKFITHNVAIIQWYLRECVSLYDYSVCSTGNQTMCLSIHNSTGFSKAGWFSFSLGNGFVLLWCHFKSHLDNIHFDSKSVLA